MLLIIRCTFVLRKINPTPWTTSPVGGNPLLCKLYVQFLDQSISHSKTNLWRCFTCGTENPLSRDLGLAAVWVKGFCWNLSIKFSKVLPLESFMIEFALVLLRFFPRSMQVKFLKKVIYVIYHQYGILLKQFLSVWACANPGILLPYSD